MYGRFILKTITNNIKRKYEKAFIFSSIIIIIDKKAKDKISKIDIEPTYKTLRKADIPKEESKNAIKRADTYFESIGVKLDTETRIPQNRKKQ